MTSSKKLGLSLGTLAATFAVGASAQAATNTVTVPAASQAGVDSGHVFLAGQAVQVTASGAWSGGVSGIGPGGTSSAGVCGPCTGAKVPNTGTIFELVGSTDGGVTWFSIGAGPTRIATTGPLRLAMNDVAGSYADNAGAVTASIADLFTASAPQTVSAVVAPDLSISVAPTLSLGTLVPSLSSTTNQNQATTAVTVTSTAANANVSVSDPSTDANKGKLVNATVGPSGTTENYALANALEVAGPSGVFSPLTSSVLVYSDPLSASSTGNEYSETTNVSFKQKINANEGLRTGTYSKALTFTAETTTP